MPTPPLAYAELSLIAQIRARFPQLPTKAIPLGIGDDCAILSPPSGQDLLVTTDFSLEGRHFRRDTHPAFSVGHRTLARGLSDLAAMGATPLASFLSLALPADLLRTSAGRRWIASFLEGMSALAQTAKVSLAGGDTAQSPTDHILADIVLLGTAPRGEALRRSTALPGDVLYLSGFIGGAAAELRTLLARPVRTGYARNPPRRARQASYHPHLFPQPRLAIGRLLRGRATACVDLSDGLATDLTHLCEASSLRAEIDAATLPICPGATLADALHGGEDYELLFSAGPATRIPHQVADVPITRIGTLLRPSSHHPRITLLTSNSQLQPLEPTTSHHFQRQ